MVGASSRQVPQRCWELLDVISVLHAALVSRGWNLAVANHVAWSRTTIRAVAARIQHVDGVDSTHITEPRRRGHPCKVLSMGPFRPKLCNFVSGGMTLESLGRLIGASRLAAGHVFADLGCGSGRQLLGAAFIIPGLHALVGFELMEGYFDAARANLTGRTNFPTVLLRHADFTADDACEWLDADVVLAVSTCFDQSQMERLARRAVHLRRGSRFVTIDKSLPSPYFKLEARVDCRGDWGPAIGYVQRRS